MVIDGKIIASNIYASLFNKVDALKIKKIYPNLAVIQTTDDSATNSYIKQKQRAADSLGIKLNLVKLPQNTESQKILDLISDLNNDKNTHGIIIQRPVPKYIDKPSILNTVSPFKDVDGFVPDSLFEAPIAMAIGEILKNIKYQISNIKFKKENDLFSWLENKNIVIIGHGKTAGKPIADFFYKHNCATFIINSQTPNSNEITKNADIIISCVGKKYIIDTDDIRKGVILISVGIWRDEKGKLHGDYDENEISKLASFYTPTPGGVGPVNVACLMQNVVKSCQ